MDLITRERDRLLQRAARIYGLCFALLSFACLLPPDTISLGAMLWTLPLYLVLVGSLWRLGVSGSIVWVLFVLVSGVAIPVVGVTLDVSGGAHLLAAIVPLVTGGTGSIGLVLLRGWSRNALLAIAFILVSASTLLITAGMQDASVTFISLVVGWLLPVLIGLWISASTPQLVQRIEAIGTAHRAERQASELEAHRRQSARLLHDTVLATLTLLAHSGVGVSAEALRAQAADDARLLRQLRLGTEPDVPGHPPFSTSGDDVVLGTTLESVKQRFGRMGLTVTWHGTGQLMLPTEVLDAFLLALAECLENVRRHSGVAEAHVTITADATTVRALVTDAGVGFDITDVPGHRLGFTESVIARLRDVGGNARLFSAPGAGTTVALEVPR